ncbi:hypothetical protein AB0B78_08530 [Streptomyces sp. NPDC040724]|uniref:hypothetical protein n=1 Tax=Streptomyces sp. NPDC040724 TaxID=3155612 RepID=UPI0033C8FD44
MRPAAQFLAEVPGHPRLLAQGEGAADLHPGRPGARAAAGVPAGSPVQHPGQDHVQCGAEDHAELSRRDTARAGRRPETPTPMPPWISQGRRRW